MNVHLTPELKKVVEQEVASGQYASASEVVREALRLLLEERQWRAQVRREVAQGVAEAKAGQLLHGERVFARLRRRVQRRSKSK